MTRRLLLALALAACAAPSAHATSPTPAPPLMLYGDESAATTMDARAWLFNPAGLGVRYPSELLVAWSRRSAKRETNEEILALGGLAFHAERVRDTSQAYGFGFALGGEPLRIGVANDWRVDARTHELDADHRLGALARPAPWLSLGGVVDHVFQPVFRHERLNRTYTLAAGLRPLALSPVLAHGWGTRLTLSGDVVIPDDGEWSQSRVRVGGELELVPGLLLRAALQDHRGVSLGLGLRAPRSAVQSQSTQVDGHHAYDTWSLDLHGGEERTVFVSRPERRVAEVRVDGDLGDDAMSGVSIFGGTSVTPVKPLHRQLARALEDPLTRGVFLDLRGVSNMAQLEELRPRIARLRAAGKPVVAYMEAGGGRGDLYLAGACDRVVASPEAEFGALGLRAERRYYRRMLQQLGVRIDRTSYGKYKSAYRNFSVDSTPAPDREALNRVLDVQQELFVSTLAADRRVPRERLLTILDGRAWRSEDLRQAGLVDSVGYREDALRMLGRLCRLGAKPRAQALARVPEAKRAWTVPARIAVVYASGGIESGRSGNDLLMGPYMGAATVVAQLERAFERRDVDAVVLRVESPGGSSLASDLIHHATERFKRETRKPFIVSMGGTAASGGYYISAAADRIFADRFTRTGSIGVLSVKPSLEGFYRRHEVRQDDFDRGAWMRGWSLGRDWTPELQASADSATWRYYASFVQHVADGRKLSWDDVNAVAQGRVWMGEDARERRLVDAIGGLDDALAEARRAAGIPAGQELRPLEFRRPAPGFLQKLMGRAVSDAWERNVHLPEPGAMLLRDEDLDDAP